MKTSGQGALARRLAAFIALGIALGACGKAKSERRDHGSGGASNTGGTPSGGSGANAGMAATGGSSAGATGSGGASGNGSSGAAGESQGGSTGGDAGAPTGGTSSGGTSSGGEGGEGGGTDCVDVCALHGAACCIPNVECVSSDSSCLVEVLAASFSSTYNYAELEQRISEIPQDLLLAFTLADVDWAAADPAPSGRFELHMSMALSQLYGTTLTTSFNHPLRVSCNGRPLFVGVTYMLMGAAAFDSPVLHADRDEQGQLILRLGSRMGVWLFGPPTEEESRLRIDRPELRGTLCLNGPLREVTEL